MSDTNSSEAVVPDTRSFLDAISDIELTFATDRLAAIKAFPTALALATEQDWALLDYMIEVFTLYPHDAALRRLGSRWRAGDDIERERLVRLVPDTDPGLHSHETADLAAVLENRARRNNTSVGDEFAKLHAQLQTAEMPRQSNRLWRNPPPRLALPPTRRVDASRLTPAKVRARVTVRGKRRPTEIEPSLVTDYVRENLFVDAEVDATTKLRQRLAELAARGIVVGGAVTPSGWTPRYPGERAPQPVDLATAIWDHQYCLHVADQREQARALAGEKTTSREDSLVWAAERTGLRGRSDRREAYLAQGNGLDDFANAITPTLGWRCVSCFVERAAIDRRPIHLRDNTLRSDDGLCDYCRSEDRPGLPALPQGFTIDALAHTYCEFFAEHYPDAAYGLITEVRRRAPEWLTTTIDNFLFTRTDLPGAPPLDPFEPEFEPARGSTRRRPARILPPGQRQDRCEGCTVYKAVHDDGFCTVCRVWLELDVPAPPDRHVAA